MKKNSVVSLALSVALSLSALSVVCATDYSGSVVKTKI